MNSLDREYLVSLLYGLNEAFARTPSGYAYTVDYPDIDNGWVYVDSDSVLFVEDFFELDKTRKLLPKQITEFDSWLKELVRYHLTHASTIIYEEKK